MSIMSHCQRVMPFWTEALGHNLLVMEPGRQWMTGLLPLQRSASYSPAFSPLPPDAAAVLVPGLGMFGIFAGRYVSRRNAVAGDRPNDNKGTVGVRRRALRGDCGKETAGAGGLSNC